MHSPHQHQAREADRVANQICKRRLMNASLFMAAAWLTYVNPFTFEVRVDGGWLWFGSVIGATLGAAGFAIWSITAGDRRAWMRAFHAATRNHLEAASSES